MKTKREQTIKQLLRLVPHTLRPKARELLQEWKSASEDIDEYFESRNKLKIFTEIALTDLFETSIEELRKKGRKNEVAFPRLIAGAYLINNSLYQAAEIGKFLNRHRTTVLHYEKTHMYMYNTDKKYTRMYDNYANYIESLKTKNSTTNDNESNNSARAENENTITTTLDILRHRVYNS